MYDEGLRQHRLECRCEPAGSSPGKVALKVLTLSPLGEAGDVVWVVLVAHDPDCLTTFPLEAVAQDLSAGASPARVAWNSLPT